jgi:hypothetical protein
MLGGGLVRLLALLAGYALVAVLLVALRFAGDIGGPWLWILAPIWLPLVFSAIAFAGLVAALGRTDAP